MLRRTLSLVPRAFPARRLALAAAGLASALLLGGCGGGAYYEYSDGGYYDNPPSVNLAAGATVAAPGSALRLVAAATDDYQVDAVDFYIRDARGDILLARDNSYPFEITTTVPSNAVQQVTYVARAVDDVGQVSRSATVSVAVGVF